MFEICYGAEVGKSLRVIPAAHRQRIVTKIVEQLTYEPTKETRNKKILGGLAFPWFHKEPMWELRVGEYRVFYDVDEEMQRVTVHAVRHKPPHKTTEEIL